MRAKTQSYILTSGFNNCLEFLQSFSSHFFFHLLALIPYRLLLPLAVRQSHGYIGNGNKKTKPWQQLTHLLNSISIIPMIDIVTVWRCLIGWAQNGNSKEKSFPSSLHVPFGLSWAINGFLQWLFTMTFYNFLCNLCMFLNSPGP